MVMVVFAPVAVVVAPVVVSVVAVVEAIAVIAIAVIAVAIAVVEIRVDTWISVDQIAQEALPGRAVAVVGVVPSVAVAPATAMVVVLGIRR